MFELVLETSGPRAVGLPEAEEFGESVDWFTEGVCVAATSVTAESWLTEGVCVAATSVMAESEALWLAVALDCAGCVGCVEWWPVAAASDVVLASLAAKAVLVVVRAGLTGALGDVSAAAAADDDVDTFVDDDVEAVTVDVVKFCPVLNR